MSFKKILSVITLVTFVSTNTSYAATGSRQLFKNKKVDYQKLSTQKQEAIQKTKSMLRGEDTDKTISQKKEAQRMLSSHLEDISQIHIPSEIGHITEVYQNPDPKANDKLIVHIQDLHTNPEGELNLAKILEILLNDYKMGLVCSEGADGMVDTSSVSRFPDYSAREKVARIFIDSGELTGEEYLSITKYPDLPIWGIEDKNIYFDNIIGFNKIMKFNPDSQVFISRVKNVLEDLKLKICSKELLTLDQKESDYMSQKIEAADYIKYLSSYIPKLNIQPERYKNIALIQQTMNLESKIDQAEIMQESQGLLLNLQSAIQAKSSRADMDSLVAKAQLFEEQGISPFSFYSYLKNLAGKHLKDDFSVKYPNINSFTDYLTKVNLIDSTRLFTELDDLDFNIKLAISKTEQEKTFIKALRNIKFLESFFNLKVSNEELDYYLNNKEDHKVTYFESFLKPLLKKYGISTFIDFNPALVDSHLDELESFYKVVKQRDIAMVNNSISEIEKRSSRVSALIAGGFHTKGITGLLKEKGYSYIVISPYSSTDINEENYHFLLSGGHKSLIDILNQLDLQSVIKNFTEKTVRVPVIFDKDIQDDFALHLGNMGIRDVSGVAMNVPLAFALLENLVAPVVAKNIKDGNQYAAEDAIGATKVRRIASDTLQIQCGDLCVNLSPSGAEKAELTTTGELVGQFGFKVTIADEASKDKGLSSNTGVNKVEYFVGMVRPIMNETKTDFRKIKNPSKLSAADKRIIKGIIGKLGALPDMATSVDRGIAFFGNGTYFLVAGRGVTAGGILPIYIKGLKGRYSRILDIGAADSNDLRAIEHAETNIEKVLAGFERGEFKDANALTLVLSSNTSLSKEETDILVAEAGNILRGYLQAMVPVVDNLKESPFGDLSGVKDLDLEVKNFIANPDQYTDKALLAKGEEYMAGTSNKTPRIEVRTSENKPVQIAIIGIPNPIAKQKVTEELARLKGLHASANLTWKTAGFMSLEATRIGVDKGLPVQYLKRNFSSLLDQMGYTPGPSIDARKTRTVVVTDFDGSLVGKPGKDTDPTFSESEARGSSLEYLNEGGVLFVNSANSGPVVIRRLVEGLPVNVQNRVIVSVNGGPDLMIFRNGNLEVATDYAENALSLAGEGEDLDMIYLDDDARPTGHARPAYMAAGLNRSITLTTADIASAKDVSPDLLPNYVGQEQAGEAKVLQRAVEIARQNPGARIFTPMNIREMVNTARGIVPQKDRVNIQRFVDADVAPAPFEENIHQVLDEKFPGVEKAIVKNQRHIAKRIAVLEERLLTTTSRKRAERYQRELNDLLKEQDFVMLARKKAESLGYPSRHGHTKCRNEDGQLTPEEVINVWIYGDPHGKYPGKGTRKYAGWGGVTDGAITPHIIMDGSNEGRKSAARRGRVVTLRPGVEWDARMPDGKGGETYMHILVHFADDPQVIVEANRFANELDKKFQDYMWWLFDVAMSLADKESFDRLTKDIPDETIMQIGRTMKANKDSSHLINNPEDVAEIKQKIFEWYQECKAHVDKHNGKPERRQFINADNKVDGRFNNEMDVVGNWTSEVFSKYVKNQDMDWRFINPAQRSLLSAAISANPELKAKRDDLRGPTYSAKEVVAKINELGGVAYWAHPYLEGAIFKMITPEEFIKQAVEIGGKLDGYGMALWKADEAKLIPWIQEIRQKAGLTEKNYRVFKNNPDFHAEGYAEGKDNIGDHPKGALHSGFNPGLQKDTINYFNNLTPEALAKERDEVKRAKEALDRFFATAKNSGLEWAEVDSEQDAFLKQVSALNASNPALKAQFDEFFSIAKRLGFGYGETDVDREQFFIDGFTLVQRGKYHENARKALAEGNYAEALRLLNIAYATNPYDSVTQSLRNDAYQQLLNSKGKLASNTNYNKQAIIINMMYKIGEQTKDAYYYLYSSSDNFAEVVRDMLDEVFDKGISDDTVLYRRGDRGNDVIDLRIVHNKKEDSLEVSYEIRLVSGKGHKDSFTIAFLDDLRTEKLGSNHRLFDIESMNDIIIRSAASVIEDKKAFMDWLTIVPPNVAVEVLAENVNEYKQVEEFKDIVHLKLLYDKSVSKKDLMKQLNLQDYQLLMLNDGQARAVFGMLDKNKQGVKLRLINDIINIPTAKEVGRGV